VVGCTTVAGVSFKSIGLSDDLHAYLVAHNPPADPVVADLIRRTRADLPDDANKQIAPEQAPFLTFLTRLLDARTAVEVGTFTGLSALSIARGMAPGGHLVCFDISAEFTAYAREVWQRAGVADRIELRLGPAAETLAGLPADPHLDLAFIDADKSSYAIYWAALVPRMRPGGVIAVDNVLRGGRVLDPGTDAEDRAIAEFNDIVRADERVESVMLPLADGLTLARRLP
jgi:predicted O-methyltransferase YrrM